MTIINNYFAYKIGLQTDKQNFKEEEKRRVNLIETLSTLIDLIFLWKQKVRTLNYLQVLNIF